jgi:hypothetical protein
MTLTSARILSWGLLLLFLFMVTGCTADEQIKEEIRNHVRQGRYEEAERKAREFFADDKLELFVLLEYIDQKRRADVRTQYLKRLTITRWQWWSDDGGRVIIAGEVLNEGDRTVRVLAFMIECLKEGTVTRFQRVRSPVELPPGMSGKFEIRESGLSGCDDVSLTLIDLGVEAHRPEGN